MVLTRKRLVALLASMLLVLSSCETIQENPKAVLGSVVGAAAGAGIVAIAGGSEGSMVAAALGGALLGGYIGKKLDDRDRKMAEQAAQQAFESGRTGSAVTWKNPDTGNSGSVTPTRTYQLADGQYCRQYRQDIYVGNEKHEATGTACRRADGTWQIQS